MTPSDYDRGYFEAIDGEGTRSCFGLAGGWSTVGALIAKEVDRLWPGEDDYGRAASLAEEVGEVCRAITKRHHAADSSDGTCKGKTVDEWTRELRVELAQVLGVVLDIAHREGFDLALEMEACLGALQARKAGS